MIKVYLAIGLLLAVTTASFWAGYQIASGKAIKQENHVIKEQVEDHNEDIRVIEKDSNDVAEKQAEHKKRLDSIPLVQPDTPCPDHSILWHEAVTVTNNLHFEN